MSKNKKRLLKRIAIVVTPVVFFGVLSYATITSQSQANKSAFAHEHYYDESSDTLDISSDIEEGDNLEDSDSIEVITNNDNVTLDTDPNSIGVLVNKELGLPKDYIPADLVVPNVLFTISYFDEKKQLRSSAAKALEDLFAGASENNLTLYGVSGYRSYQRQYDIFTSNIKKQGLQHTMKYSAKPGYSEHQTGLSIDVSAKSVNNRLDASFGETEEGKWLEENAHLYGFIIRYPENKIDITGYSYEPWHIRYVGKSLATYLYKNDLCLEEYYKFTPSEDYSNEISYDNLVDYGIDLNDVIEKPTPAPTVAPEQTTEDSTVESTTEDNTIEKNTVEEDTTEDKTIDETVDETTPTDVPTKEDGVKVTPKPTKAVPTPTAVPTKVPKPTPKPTLTPKPTPTAKPTPTKVPESTNSADSTDTNTNVSQ